MRTRVIQTTGGRDRTLIYYIVEEWRDSEWHSDPDALTDRDAVLRRARTTAMEGGRVVAEFDEYGEKIFDFESPRSPHESSAARALTDVLASTARRGASHGGLSSS